MPGKPWEKGQSGNPLGMALGPKPYRHALRLEAYAHENGGKLPKVKPGSLRDLARRALDRARNSTATLDHVADRLDGKVAQPIANDDENPPVQIVEVRLIMVGENGEPTVIEGQPIAEKPKEIEAKPLDPEPTKAEIKRAEKKELARIARRRAALLLPKDKRTK